MRAAMSVKALPMSIWLTAMLNGRPSSAAVWKLRLENLSAEETLALVAVRTDTNPLQFELSAGKPSALGQVVLTAKLTLSGAPATGAIVSAKINGAKEITLFDDGRHADGAAGDGVYGATTEKLKKGDYFVEANAEKSGQKLAAKAFFKIEK